MMQDSCHELKVAPTTTNQQDRHKVALTRYTRHVSFSVIHKKVTLICNNSTPQLRYKGFIRGKSGYIGSATEPDMPPIHKRPTYRQYGKTLNCSCTHSSHAQFVACRKHRIRTNRNTVINNVNVKIFPTVSAQDLRIAFVFSLLWSKIFTYSFDAVIRLASDQGAGQALCHNTLRIAFHREYGQ